MQMSVPSRPTRPAPRALAVFMLVLLALTGPPRLLRAADKAAAAPSSAQEPVEPLACWSRTSASAVRVGEVFSLVITCSVLDTPSLKVVPDESKLEPTTLQLPPFDVVGGRHAADLREGDRRFFQYQYDLRLVSDALFGKDAPLPPITLTYRIQTGVGAKGSSEGLERTYVLPPQMIRVLTLVPSDASDIRDASASTFVDLDAAVLRARALMIAGVVLAGLAVLLAVMSLFRRAGAARKAQGTAEHWLSDRRILARVDRELAAIDRQRGSSGWTPELGARVLVALRIVGNYLVGTPVNQRVASADDSTVDGALSMRGVFAKNRTLVSGSTTAQNAAAAASRAPRESGRDEARALRLEDAQQALAALSGVQYGRETDAPDASLDAALAAGRRLIRPLRREHLWIVTILNAAAARTTTFGRRVWAR